MPYILLTHQKALVRSSVTAALGATLGALLVVVGMATAEPEPTPRTVSATLIQIGEHLCKDWSRLRNIQRVSQDAYTFTCGKYATFSDLEVTDVRSAQR